MKAPLILPTGALLAGICFGFVVGRIPGDSRKEDGTGGSPIRGTDRGSWSSGDGSGHYSGSNRLSVSRVSRRSDLQMSFAVMSSSQLADEAAKLRTLPSAESLGETLLLYGAWAEVDPLAALSHARRMGPAGEAARRQVLQGWASYAPAAAAEWFQENKAQFSPEQPPGNGSGAATERMNAAAVIGRAWAKEDASAALAWATSLDGDFARSVDAVISEVAREDPRKAVRLADGLESGGGTKAREAIATQWGSTDFAAANSWIKTLPSAEQDLMRSRALSALAVSDPRAAAKEFDQMSDGADKERGVAELMKNWGAGDFHEAERWLAVQESDSVKKAGIESLIAEVSVADSASAKVIIDSVTPGPARDGALAAYIRSSAPNQPQSLLVLVDGISNDADRWQSLAWVMSRWKQEDPEAAESYLKENFSDEGNAIR